MQYNIMTFLLLLFFCENMIILYLFLISFSSNQEVSEADVREIMRIIVSMRSCNIRLGVFIFMTTNEATVLIAYYLHIGYIFQFVVSNTFPTPFCFIVLSPIFCKHIKYLYVYNIRIRGDVVSFT